MFKYRTIFLLIATLNFAGNCFGQSDFDSLRTTSPGRKYPLSSILGTWRSVSDTTATIRFDQHEKMVQVSPILHGVGPYMFNVYDDTVAASGYAPNWPPYDCILNLVDSNHLEMLISQYYWPQPQRLKFQR